MGERLKIIVNDCLTNGDFLSCEVIGQGSVYLFEKVPAGQVRAANTYVSDMNELPRATGKASWYLSVTEATAADH
jgi:hypothetical protein